MFANCCVRYFHFCVAVLQLPLVLVVTPSRVSISSLCLLLLPPLTSPFITHIPSVTWSPSLSLAFFLLFAFFLCVCYAREGGLRSVLNVREVFFAFCIPPFIVSVDVLYVPVSSHIFLSCLLLFLPVSLDLWLYLCASVSVSPPPLTSLPLRDLGTVIAITHQM